MNRLKQYYNNVILWELIQKGNYINSFEVPKLNKIVIHIIRKQTINHPLQLLPAKLALELITGQNSTQTFAKQSIAAFKLQKDIPVGAKVTLRGDIIYNFFEKLIIIILPRQREFKGLSLKGFDGHGNYQLGLENIFIFPELESAYNIFQSFIPIGLNITLVTSSKSDSEAKLLLSNFQFPLNFKI